MESHVDTHWSNFPTQHPVIGEITGVLPKDHASNTTGKVTMYQVKALMQRPAQPVTLGYAPLLNQSAGFSHERESPLVVGQRCVVIFMEGDPQRPVILGTFPYVGPKSTPTAAQTDAEAPQERAIANGVDLTIDKTGNMVLKLAEDKKLEVQDSAGAVLMEIEKSGGSYTINLGGDAGTERLMTESMVQALVVLLGAAVVTPGDGGATLKSNIASALNAAFTTANSTIITKAK